MFIRHISGNDVFILLVSITERHVNFNKHEFLFKLLLILCYPELNFEENLQIKGDPRETRWTRNTSL